jgi:hypothetical protein
MIRLTFDGTSNAAFFRWLPRVLQLFRAQILPLYYKRVLDMWRSKVYSEGMGDKRNSSTAETPVTSTNTGGVTVVNTGALLTQQSVKDAIRTLSKSVGTVQPQSK